MEQKPQNPLFKHFRQPAIYARIPSNGRFWPEGSLDLPITGELPFYPMTARDEITLRTPDALLNGQGVVDVIQSCCPNIKNAWAMPSIDVDAVLLNIRIASYGNNMDIDTTCGKCGEENRFGVDLGVVAAGIQLPDYDTPLEVDNLKIILRPQPYFNVNQNSQLAFTEQQILRTVNDSEMSDEEKKAKTDAYLSKLIDLNIDICAKSTDRIITDEGVVVNNPEYIAEFYNLADYKIMRVIQTRLKNIAETMSLKPVHVSCSGCQTQNDIPINFDYASFFDQGF